MSCGFTIVIPTRFAASRLPGKPLLPIAGRPLVEHVWRRALGAGAKAVIIATDDDRIVDAARGFGADVEMTSADHASGTDRLAEVINRRALDDSEIVVNWQGDEPLLPPELAGQVAERLAACADCAVASLYVAIDSAHELADPAVVKVVTDAEDCALYFSRASIPFDRDGEGRGPEPKRHLGVYAYRAGAIRDFVTWPPAPIELAEKLEQLRFLYNGRRIAMARALWSLARRPHYWVKTPHEV